MFKYAVIAALLLASTAAAYWPRTTIKQGAAPDQQPIQATSPTQGRQTQPLPAGATAQVLNTAGQVIGQVSNNGKLQLLAGKTRAEIASLQLVNANGNVQQYVLSATQKPGTLSFQLTQGGTVAGALIVSVTE